MSINLYLIIGTLNYRNIVKILNRVENLHALNVQI